MYYVYVYVFVYVYGGVSFVRVHNSKVGGPRVPKVVDGPWGWAPPGGDRKLIRDRSIWKWPGTASVPVWEVPLHPLALSKGINAALNWSKALQKLMFAALGRHPSLSKVDFSMKTIKTHRENEGPTHEPCIFTCISVLRWQFIQIYCVLLRNERVFFHRIFAMILRHA